MKKQTPCYRCKGIGKEPVYKDKFGPWISLGYLYGGHPCKKCHGTGVLVRK